jgi:transcription initiation factor TFIIB
MSGPTISCRYHPDAILIESHHAGDMVCQTCGLVVGDRVVDVGSEWRTFSDSNNDPSRVGAAESPFLENDLSTRIGASAGTEYHNRSSMSSTNRTLLNAFRDINEIADRVNLPKTITDEAAGLFKQVHEQKRLRNRPRLSIVSACIYLACRLQGAARSFKELSTISGVQACLIAKCYKAILKTVDTPRQPLSTHVDSGAFMSRFCSNLGLPNEVQRIASHIAAVVKEKSVADGRNPTSIAAAAIYMASQVSDTKRSQKEISEVAGVADSTLKQAYRLMLERASELIPPDSPFHSRIDQLPSS